LNLLKTTYAEKRLVNLLVRLLYIINNILLIKYIINNILLTKLEYLIPFQYYNIILFHFVHIRITSQGMLTARCSAFSDTMIQISFALFLLWLLGGFCLLGLGLGAAVVAVVFGAAAVVFVLIASTRCVLVEIRVLRTAVVSSSADRTGFGTHS
jgi:hypothetical protein